MSKVFARLEKSFPTQQSYASTNHPSIRRSGFWSAFLSTNRGEDLAGCIQKALRIQVVRVPFSVSLGAFYLYLSVLLAATSLLAWTWGKVGKLSHVASLGQMEHNKPDINALQPAKLATTGTLDMTPTLPHLDPRCKVEQLCWQQAAHKCGKRPIQVSIETSQGIGLAWTH